MDSTSDEQNAELTAAQNARVDVAASDPAAVEKPASSPAVSPGKALPPDSTST